MGCFLIWMGIFFGIVALIWSLLSIDSYPDHKKRNIIIVVALIVATVICLAIGIELI